jgi:hypothetical protein
VHPKLEQRRADHPDLEHDCADPSECTWATNRPALRRASVHIFHYAATRFFCDALGFSVAGERPAYGHVHLGIYLHVVEGGALSIGESVSGVN